MKKGVKIVQLEEAKVEEDAISEATKAKLRHYYCHKCGVKHIEQSPIWYEHHPKLIKILDTEKQIKEVNDGSNLEETSL